MSGQSLYAYVWNNPTNYTDPTGFEAVTPVPPVYVDGCWVCNTTTPTAENGMFTLVRASTALRAALPFFHLPVPLLAIQFKSPEQIKRDREVAHLLFGGLVAAEQKTEEEEKKADADALDAKDGEKKDPPNPDGKKGGKKHQEEVAQAEKDLKEKYKDDPNIEIRTEVRVKTPDGEKSSRYIDVAAVDKETGEIVEGVQVGRQTKAEIPVSRERRAIKDINTVLPDTTINFRPYNK